MKELEKELAICQMQTIHTVLSGAGMDIDTAIEQLNLDNPECLKIAREENLEWVGDNIQSILLKR